MLTRLQIKTNALQKEAICRALVAQYKLTNFDS